jgi:hypothetical protein
MNRPIHRFTKQMIPGDSPWRCPGLRPPIKSTPRRQPKRVYAVYCGTSRARARDAVPVAARWLASVDSSWHYPYASPESVLVLANGPPKDLSLPSSPILTTR